eukprot:GHVQ01036402.1.p1 GENE.GHVQ01036402.1~~GHVQ01036402.1.p1  ORF type:complete len:452 (+),score=122.69 GHVQ01036402.1:560-1915(+)
MAFGPGGAVSRRGLACFVWLWGGGNFVYLYFYLKEIKKTRPKFESTDPPPDEHRQDWFNRNAYCMDTILDNFDDLRVVSQKRAKLFRAAKGHVLEVGAGTGRNFEALRTNSKVKSLTCVEMCDNMCDVMKLKLEEARLPFPVCVVQGDMCELPFDAEAFDSTISSFTLCSCFGDVHKGVTEISRVTKRNGRLLFLERGVPQNWLYRTLYRQLSILPNPRVPWELGFYEDRVPTDILDSANVPANVVKYANFGIFYLISTLRPNMYGAQSVTSTASSSSSTAVPTDFIKGESQQQLPQQLQHQQQQHQQLQHQQLQHQQLQHQQLQHQQLQHQQRQQQQQQEQQQQQQQQEQQQQQTQFPYILSQDQSQQQQKTNVQQVMQRTANSSSTSGSSTSSSDSSTMNSSAGSGHSRSSSRAVDVYYVHIPSKDDLAAEQQRRREEMRRKWWLLWLG